MAGTGRGTREGTGERLRASFWLVPGVMTAAAAVLAAALVRLGERVDGRLRDISPWLFSGDAESAAELLGTIAGSIITVAGVVFSVTVVALTLVSQRQTPWVLRTFMRDRVAQVVLGGFIGTFTYCLVVLRSIRGTEGEVPEAAVTAGVALALVAVGLLILFIHHLVQMVQVAHVVAQVTRETVMQVPRLFPALLGEPRPEAAEPADLGRTPSARVRAADEFGYVQVVDGERIFKAALQADVLIRLECRPGQFVSPGGTLASVWPAERASDSLAAAVRAGVITGRYPSSRHDVEFGIRQIADMAVRALSPGVNDPTTATTCIDHLGVILGAAINRERPSPYRRDDEGNLRVVAWGPDFAELVHLAFDPIREYGKRDPRVLGRVLTVLLGLSELTEDRGRRTVLAHAGQQAARAAEQGLDDEEDRAGVMRLARRVMALRPPPEGSGVSARSGGWNGHG